MRDSSFRVYNYSQKHYLCMHLSLDNFTSLLARRTKTAWFSVDAELIRCFVQETSNETVFRFRSNGKFHAEAYPSLKREYRQNQSGSSCYGLCSILTVIRLFIYCGMDADL